MIELRWMEKHVPDSFYEHDGSVATVRIEKVLQYRQWQVRIDASGAITPLPAPIEWTPWIDVPTASAEAGE